MKYQRKITEVEAFQLTAETYHDNTDWPAWAHEAWNKGAQELGALYRKDSDVGYYVNSNSGQQPVNPGDWIAVGPDGVELYPITDEAFRKLYAVTDEDTFRVSLTIEADEDGQVELKFSLAHEKGDTAKPNRLADAINGMEHVIKQLREDRDAALVYSAVHAALETLQKQSEDEDDDTAYESLDAALKRLGAE